MIMHEPEIGETHDGTGAADHDTPWSWGHPLACLTWPQQARLLVMKGYVLDMKRGEPGLASLRGDVEPPAPEPPTPEPPDIPAVLDIGQYWLDDT